jgi:hypothetical protein
MSSRKIGSRCFQNNRVSNRVREALGSFYSLQMESFHWGVKDLNMSGLKAGYVRKGLMESSLGTGYVQCLDLTWVNSGRSDISGSKTGYARNKLL